MGRHAFATISLLLLVVTAVVVVGLTGRAVVEPEQKVAEARGKLPGEQAHAHRASASSGDDPHRALAARRATDAERYNADHVEIGDTFWQPATRAEVDWMNRNMYPSASAMVRSAGMGAVAHLPVDGVATSGADLLNAGSVAKNHPEQFEAAMRVLEAAASSGSTYALQSIGRVIEFRSGAGVESESYYRAAVLRGDWTAGARVPARLGPEENYAADLRARQILSGFDQARLRAGLAALQVDVRPELETAVQLWNSR